MPSREKKKLDDNFDKRYSLAQLNAGDDKLFAEVIEYYGPVITNHINSLLGYPKDRVPSAEDLSQDVMLKLWNNRKKINLENGFADLSNYIFGSARHKVIDDSRLCHTRLTIADGDLAIRMTKGVVPSPVKQLELKETVVQAVTFVEQNLPEKQCQALFLWGDGLSGKELMAEMGENMNQVKGKVYNAQRRLRKNIDLDLSD